MKLSICVATMRPMISGVSPGDIPLAELNAVTSPTVHVQYNTPELNLGVVGSYQKLYEQVSNTTKEDVLCFMHDDVIVRERGWDERVLREFNDPSVGAVGFGGAIGIGVNDIYKIPYAIPQLIRIGYMSNTDDAEIHGSRYDGSADVAVLDGFALCVRRGLLDRLNGFSFLIQNGIDFLMYDATLCCLAIRARYRIRVVGVRCQHRGGSTSVAMRVDRAAEYETSHSWFYQEFRDLLPLRV